MKDVQPVQSHHLMTPSMLTDAANPSPDAKTRPGGGCGSRLCIGIAADHGGFELRMHLLTVMREQGWGVIDFGDRELNPSDDYPDFVIPLARAVASGDVCRGIAVCGSGVGAAVAANRIAGVRACLIQDTFSARQGVEDDDLNMICLGGRVVGPALAWELVKVFLAADFSGEARHRRRLAKASAACIGVDHLKQLLSDGRAFVAQTLAAGISIHHEQTVSEAKEAWRNEGNPN